MSRSLRALAAAIGCLVWQAHLTLAAASGNAIAHFGGEHGTVNTTNPTALYFNPAGIGFSEGNQLFIDGQLAMRSLHWTHEPSLGDVPPPLGFTMANTGRATAFNVFGGPMLGATFQPLSHLTLGVAGYAPFGGRVQFDGAPEFAASPFPGAADGVARWHGIDASTMSIYGTLGAAYRIGPVSIGASVNLIYTTLQLNRAQNLNVTNDLHGEGRGRLDVSGLNGSFALGVTVEALPSQLWLSLSYQAQPGLGPIELNGKLEVDSSVPKNDDSLVTDVSLHEALPDIWRLGARYRLRDDLELRAEADLTHWSVVRTQCIAVRGLPCWVTPSGDAAADSGVIRNLRRYWRDTYALRTGLSYWPTSPLELFAGLGFETAAAPDATLDPVLADAPNVLIAFGGRMRVASHWHIAASYTYLQFLPRDNTGSSRLADPATAQITRGPDGGGYYTQWAGILNANVQASF